MNESPSFNETTPPARPKGPRNTWSMEDVNREGCEERCSWRDVAEQTSGLDTSSFTFEDCELAIKELDLKGLSKCGLAGVSVAVSATERMFTE